MKKKKKAKKIARAIRLIWDSLDSHLGYTNKPYKHGERKGFHKKCVREYAEVIYTLSKLY